MCVHASALILDAEAVDPDPDPLPDPLPLFEPLPEPDPLPPFEPVPPFAPEFPLSDTDTPEPLPESVVFPIPLPASLSFADILDKSENIGLSLFVIPYAATAAATHNTIIMEMIIFALSNFFPPINLILKIIFNFSNFSNIYISICVF